MLVGPGGQNTLLMSDAGGGGDITGLNFTFDDAAAATLPDATQLSGGTFKPSNYDTTTDAFPAPAPPAGATVAMSVFNGTNPNGTWALYVRDDLGLDLGSIAGGWTLNIATTGSCGTPTATSTGTPTTATPTATATATGTPAAFSIQFSSATYVEDESQIASITVTRTGSTAGTNSVSFTATNGTASGGVACTTGVDFIAVTGQTVTFNPGETSKTVNVTVCGDNLTEPDQTVLLSLTGTGVGSPSTAVLTINDTATVFRNTTAITINNGGAGSPYPSAINVSSGPTQIGSMRVTIYDLSATIPDFADFLLVGPGGQEFILMANAGGSSAGGPVTLNFTDTAGAVVPDGGPLVTGDFEPTSYGTVADFPAPAPAGPYNLPGGTVGGSGTQTLFGNFGGTNSNGTWSLYVRDDTTSNAPTGTGSIAGGWGIEFLGSTAAHASISGRVTTATGLGIRNARIVVTGNSIETPIVVATGSFGSFAIEGLRTGETYVVTVNSQRYTFSTPSRVISLVDNVVDADFIADPQE